MTEHLLCARYRALFSINCKAGFFPRLKQWLREVRVAQWWVHKAGFNPSHLTFSLLIPLPGDPVSCGAVQCSWEPGSGAFPPGFEASSASYQPRDLGQATALNTRVQLLTGDANSTGCQVGLRAGSACGEHVEQSQAHGGRWAVHRPGPAGLTFPCQVNSSSFSTFLATLPRPAALPPRELFSPFEVRTSDTPAPRAPPESGVGGGA